MVQSKKLGLSLKEIPIPRCHCKDFESLPIWGSHRLALYKMAKRPCTCGSGLFHCNSQGHLAALEGMIATYEKLDSPVKAREHASLLIIISPRAPEGYLRLAKALRLCDTAQSPDTTARCRWIYRQAIESVQAYGNKDHDKLKVCSPPHAVHSCLTLILCCLSSLTWLAYGLQYLLQSLANKLSQVLAGLLRRDIIGSLPVELRNMILGNLSNADLCRSMRVSKSWKGVCLDPTLWKHLTIVKNWSAAKPRPLRKRAFNNIITKRAQANIKSLTLWGVHDFGISLETFKATLKVLDRLEFLSLKGTDGVDGTDLDFPGAPPCHEWSKSVFEGAPPCLKTLRLGGFRTMDLPPDWPLPSRIPMAQSLEELSLGQLTGRSVTPRMLLSTVWPKLTKLRMVRTKDHFPLRVDLVRISTISLFSSSNFYSLGITCQGHTFTQGSMYPRPAWLQQSLLYAGVVGEPGATGTHNAVAQ